MASVRATSERPEDRPYRWWVLSAAMTAQTTAAVSTQGIGVLGGFIQADFGLTNAGVGALAGVLNVAPVLGLLFVGAWLDQAGERLVIGTGAFVMGLSMAATGLVTGLAGLLVCLLFVGVGYSTAQPGGSKAVFHWFAPRERGLAMGLRQAGLPLGGVMAAALFPGIANDLGWRSAFLAGAGVVLAGGALFCLVYHSPNREGPAALPAGSSDFIPMRSHARALLALPAFRLAAFAGVVLITLQTIALMFLALYYRDSVGMPLTLGAVHLLLMQLAGAAGRIVLAALSDRIARGRTVMVAATAVGCLTGLVAVGLVPAIKPDPVLLYAASAWLGFFGFGWYGPWVAWITEISPHERLGTTLGIAMAINQIAIVVTPIVFGALVDAAGGYRVPGAVLMGGIAMYLGYASLVAPRVSRS